MKNPEEFYTAVMKARPFLPMGVGTTPAEAIADAQAGCSRAYIYFDEEDYVAKRCTAAFFRNISSTFRVLESGLICTKEEHSAEEGAAWDRFVDMTMIASAIYGDEWIAPLARDLRIELHNVQLWAAHRVAVPVWLPAKLAALARKAVDNGVPFGLEQRAKAIRQAAA